MEHYEGEYFKNRGFYDWGIDYEIMKIKDEFSKEIDRLKFYRNNFIKGININLLRKDELEPLRKKTIDILINNANINDLEKIMKRYDEIQFKNIEAEVSIILKELKNEFIWIKKIINLREISNDYNIFNELFVASEYLRQLYIHNKMCFINIYTIMDEKLTELIKALGMYVDDFLNRKSIRISHSKLKKFENETDLKEHFIDRIIDRDKNLSGITNKVKYLLKYYKWNNDFNKLEEVKLFTEVRNCIIHSKDKFNKKAIKNINPKLVKKLNLTEGKKVDITSEKVDEYIDLSEEIMNFFFKKIIEKYFGDNYLFEINDEN